MRVPLRLARVDVRAATDAVLLVPADAAALADAVARCGDVPAVHRVRGGFLLVPRGEPTRPLPGLPLRRLAGDFYVPVDAVPRPALLPDELVGLTRERGLVLLPHGPPLMFDAAAPLPPSAWLRVSEVGRGDWRRFVEPPPLADRLTVIEKPSPPAAVVEVLGGQPDGALSGKGEPGAVPDEARPASGSLKDRLIAGATMGAASALAGLGKLLGSGALGRLAAKLARKAIDRVPRMTEKVFGEQEAALREVLRQLQSGDVERGLRRAPIAVGDPTATGRIDTGSRLADRNPRYSLGALLGAGSGTAAGWLGGGDVWGLLAAEYRRLADEAVKRGDFRRAAYLHGVLLRDVRAAANILASGGLHRDAARLYRDKLNDPVAAAVQFDRAGDHDEAVRLYLKHEMEESAADLLRRIGDEERAIELYRRAADRLSARESNLAAGDLMRRKAGDLERAMGFYYHGWLRGRSEAVECGHRLLDEHLLAEDWPAAAAQFDDAETRLGNVEAGRFFNYALGLGSDFLPRDRRADLEDRVRLLFAKQLREGTGRVMDLFGRSEAWPASVARDAAVASRPSRAMRKWEPPTDKPIHVADGTVRAVALSRDSRDLVVATTHAVVVWRVDSGKVFPITTTNDRAVFGVSIDPNAWVVYVLFGEGSKAYVQCFQLDGEHYQARGRYDLLGRESTCGLYDLQANAANYFGELQVTVSVDGVCHTLAGVHLKPVKPAFPHGDGSHAIIANGGDRWEWGGSMSYRIDDDDWASVASPWYPSVPPDSELSVAPVDWHSHQEKLLDVVGTDHEGCLHWSRFIASGPTTVDVLKASERWEYVAACLEGPGLVVAATRGDVIRWLRVDGSRLVPCHPERKLSVPARVAFLAHRPHRREFVALLEDGTAVRFTR